MSDPLPPFASASAFASPDGPDPSPPPPPTGDAAASPPRRRLDRSKMVNQMKRIKLERRMDESRLYCHDEVRAFAECATGRSVSTVWACKEVSNAMHKCMRDLYTAHTTTRHHSSTQKLSHPSSAHPPPPHTPRDIDTQHTTRPSSPRLPPPLRLMAAVLSRLHCVSLCSMDSHPEPVLDYDDL